MIQKVKWFLISILIFAGPVVWWNWDKFRAPWSPDFSWGFDAQYYLPFVIITFISGLFWFSSAGPNAKKKNHTKEWIGTILNIEHDRMQARQATFKVTADYAGVQHVFKDVSGDLTFHIGIGDKVVIFSDPDNPEDASLDVQTSIARKTELAKKNA
ncbi:hypothetical protein CBF23_002765 [Marinomonas agarivorans]|nr:hypothetical protein CBF23_002765 [Marinomonas agarivorans]